MQQTFSKPALARGELRAIGATTLKEYQKYFEKDKALERRFQPIYVQPPDLNETIEILRGLKSKYEIHHRVKISDEAIRACVTLSDRYIAERFLPDKAIDVMDETGARLKLKRLKISPELRELEKDLIALATDECAPPFMTDLEGRGIALCIIDASHVALTLRTAPVGMLEHKHALAVGGATGKYACTCIAGVEQWALLITLAWLGTGALYAALFLAQAVTVLPAFDTAGINAVGRCKLRTFHVHRASGAGIDAECFLAHAVTLAEDAKGVAILRIGLTRIFV